MLRYSPVDGRSHQSERIEPTADADIHWDEAGVAGETLVVLIHGSLDRSAGMARLARLVSERNSVLRYDRRGYGRSWPHGGPFGVADQLEDLARCLRGRPAVLVGHSFGGHIALRAASELGEQILGVSVYESPMSWHSWWPGDTAGGIGITAGPEKAAEAFLVRLLGRAAWEALPERTKAHRRREGVALVGELGALRAGPPWNPGSIRCRVVCGVGSRALNHHQRGMRWLTSELPRGELVVLEGAGHGAPQSHPRDFNERLIAPHLGHGRGA